MSIMRKCQKSILTAISTKSFTENNKYKTPKVLNAVCKQKTKAQQGQLVIEYVLLLTVVTILATTVIRLLIGQGASPDEQGLVVQKWSSIINAISADMIDN